VSNVKDISGQRFGALVAVETVGTENGQRLWRCECDCGGEKIATAAELMYGNITSCGCGTARKERNASHNADGTRLPMLVSNKPPRNNTTGVRGVSIDKQRGLYVAQIKFCGKHIMIGRYKTLEDAAEARRAKEHELFDPVLRAHGIETEDEIE
jgi:hypothetical protein